jgi:LemA protein
MTLYIVLGLIVLIVLWGISVYNSFIRLGNLVKNSFSQIDVQLKRRYDLIPNLVETAKGYLTHEKETLEAVIKARNQAFGLNETLSKNLSNPQFVKDFNLAEGALSQSLGRLMVVAESYPDLKANTTMNQLMEELTSTENKISFARQAYNDSVMVFNNAIQVFPNSIIAGNRFQPAQVFEITNSQERENIKVQFHT